MRLRSAVLSLDKDHLPAFLRADCIKIFDNTGSPTFGESNFGKVDSMVGSRNRRVSTKDSIACGAVEGSIRDELGYDKADVSLRNLSRS